MSFLYSQTVDSLDTMKSLSVSSPGFSRNSEVVELLLIAFRTQSFSSSCRCISIRSLISCSSLQALALLSKDLFLLLI